MLPPCVHDIAEYYDVPVTLIETVREVEAGQIGKLDCGRRNNTCDIGPMQINTWWTKNILPKYGVQLEEVRDNYCQNLAIGTWILRMEYDRFGNWPEALAAYNAGASYLKIGEKYSNIVLKRWRKKLNLSDK